MVAEGQMSTGTTYQWLEPKPYKRHTRQLGIRGRNMVVWNLVGEVVVSGRTAQEVADDYGLPLDAVNEALDYYWGSGEPSWISTLMTASTPTSLPPYSTVPVIAL
jgi:uncharacterized protein (DUF433 family)